MTDIPFDFPKLLLLSESFLIIGKVQKYTHFSIIVELWNEKSYQGISQLIFLPRLYSQYTFPRGVVIDGNFDLQKEKIILKSDAFLFKDFKLLQGWYVAIYTTALPKLESKEFYIGDLIGKSIYTKSGIFIGYIKELADVPTPYPMLIVTTSANEKIFLPLPREYLIDIKPQKIIVSDEIPL